MASIRKKNNSYEIRVSCGYDVNGKQKFQQMTWKPAEGMTPKQIEKEVNRQAVLFEEACRKGQIQTLLQTLLISAKRKSLLYHNSRLKVTQWVGKIK